MERDHRVRAMAPKALEKRVKDQGSGGMLPGRSLLAQTYPTLSEPESVGPHWSPDVALAAPPMVGGRV